MWSEDSWLQEHAGATLGKGEGGGEAGGEGGEGGEGTETPAEETAEVSTDNNPFMTGDILDKCRLDL